MRNVRRLVVFAVVLGAACSMMIGDASATTLKVAPAAPAASIGGYQVVQGADTTIPAGQRWYGQATCPSGTNVVGGGAYSTAVDTGVSMGGNLIDGLSWYSIYDNADATDSTVNAYAVCTAPITGLSYPQAEQFNTARTHLHLVAVCPTGSEVLGGGATNGDDNGLNHLGERMASSYPIKSGTGASAVYSWAVDMNNTYKAVDVDVIAFAICAPIGSVPGYRIVKGPAVVDAPLSQGNAQVACPSTKAPLSGGVHTPSAALKLSINSTYPFGISWGSYVNNPLLKNVNLVPYAVCANN